MAKRGRKDDRNRAIGKDPGPEHKERPLGSINAQTNPANFSQTPPPEGIERELPYGRPSDDLHPQGVEHHPDERSGTNYGTPPGAPMNTSGNKTGGNREQESRSMDRKPQRDDERWKVPEGNDRTRDPEFEMPDPEEAERARREGEQIRDRMEKGRRDKAA